MENVFKEQFTDFLKTQKNVYNHYFFVRHGEYKDKFQFNAHVSIKGENNLYIITQIRPTFKEKSIAQLFDKYLKELLKENDINFEFANNIIRELFSIGQRNGLYQHEISLEIKRNLAFLFDNNIDKEVKEDSYTPKMEYNYELLNFARLHYGLYKKNEKQEKKDKNIDVELSIINENGVLKPAITFQWYFIKNVYREYTIPIYEGANYIIEEVNRKRRIISLENFYTHIDDLNSKMVYSFCSKYIDDMPSQSDFLKLSKLEQFEYAEAMKMISY